MKNLDTDGTKDLFLAGLGGDKPAYEAALVAIAEVVRAHVGRRFSAMGLEAEVEDVVQTVLIAIHEKRATYDRSRPLMPWVHGVTKYKLLQHLRTIGRRRNVISDQAFDTILDAHDSPSADISAETDVATLLATLSPDQRNAVHMTKLQGLSMEEAASKQGIGVSAMKLRVHRAMKRLKDLTGER